MSPLAARLLAAALAVAPAAALAACHPRPLPPLPPTTAAPPPAIVTLVWVGRGEASRWDGATATWRRDATYDYDFTVVQRRYADHWESLKSITRRDPGYDGRGGARAQIWFFRVDLAPAQGGVAMALATTLGDGAGRADPDFRDTDLRLAAAQRGAFVPYDSFHIQQHYRYEDGRLDETVELDDADRPFMRNDEHAALFGPQRFAAPPTRFGADAGQGEQVQPGPR